METRAGDPGAFAHFDLDRVNSPAFVVDAAKLRANCQVLADIRDAAAMNEAWDAWVDRDNPPARATIEGKLVDPRWKGEIIVTAALKA